MKKFLATLGIVGLLGMNVGTALAAAPKQFIVTSVAAGSQTGTLTAGVAGSATYTVTVSGADGTSNGAGKATLSVAGLPSGVSYSPSSQQSCSAPSCAITLTLTTTIAALAVTGQSFTVTATGNESGSATTTGSLTINTGNTAPVATAQSVSLNEDTATGITLAGTDADLNSLTFATSSNPAHGTLSSFSAASGTVTYTPTGNYNGSDSFDFRVNDGTVNSATATVSITIASVNDTPSFTVSSSTITVTEDSGAFSLANWATSLFAGAANETVQLLDFIVGLDMSSLFSVLPSVSPLGTLTFTPAANANGSATVTAKIHDNGGGADTSASSTFTISITPTNDAPTLNSIGNKSVNENVLLSFTVTATDLDADTLTYSASNLPAGSTFTPGTRIFSWIPSYSDAGTYSNVHFEVTDGTATTSEDITITVNNVNRAPVLTAIGNQTVDEDSTLSITLTATDPDGDAITYSATGNPTMPSGSIFIADTFSWTPDFSQAGNYSVTFGVSDGTLDDSEAVSIDVGDVNRTPSLAVIADQTVDELSQLSFAASTTDPDGDSFTYSLSGAAYAAGATIDPVTGDFTWTPTEAQDGTYGATVTVTEDSTAIPLSTSKTFSITVNEVNLVPVTSDESETTNEDTSATTTLSAVDTDTISNVSQAITYTIVTQPLNGSVVLTGDEAVYTPDLNWNGTDSYEYVADDGVEVGATSTVTVTVDPVNDIPTISLRGPNPLLLTKDYFGYVDEMVNAIDVEDGDISANAVIVGSPIDTSVMGSFLVTYSITDSDSGTATVQRPVNIIPQIGGAGGPSGEVGCRDPRATNYSPSAGYDGITCTYAPVGEVLGASTSTESGTVTATTTATVSTSTPAGQVLGVSTYAFTRNLRVGSREVDVLELQKILMNEGFFVYPELTKYFGPITKAALAKWQTKHGIPSTGYFGKLSRAFLLK